MSDSFFDSKQYYDGLKKIGPNSKFTYRSKYDPLTEEEYKLLCEFEECKS